MVYMEKIESGATDAGLKKLESADVGFEYMLNALRMSAGFSETAFASRTGLSIEDINGPIESARVDGMIERSGDGVWQPTASGFRFLNELQARFLP
jgi:oxygen-independent coproporphyrinogen-3 oxidase